MIKIRDTKDSNEILSIFSNHGFLSGIEKWYGEKINFIYGGDAIAWRTSNKTNINLLNEITSSFAYLSTQKLSIYGFLGHEDGHKLFSDFNVLDNTYTQMSKNNFAFDETLLDGYPNFDEFKKDCHRNSVQNLWHNLANIIEDIYIEYRLLIDEDLRKKYGVGIIMNNERSQMLQDTVESDLNNENCNKFYAIHNALISYKAQERVLWGKTVPDEIRDSINASIDIIEDYCYCENATERVIGATKLACFLWDYIKEILPEEENEDNSNTTSNSNSSAQTTKAGNGNTTQSSIGTNPSSSGSSSKAEAKQKLQKAKEKTEKELKEKSASQLAKRAEETGSNISSSGGNLIEQAQASAQEDFQQEVAEKTDAEKIGSIRSEIEDDLHAGVKVICQKVSIGNSNKTAYETLKKQIAPHISKTINALETVQQQVNRGKHYNYYGKKFVSRRAYRTDLKVFETPKTPEKQKSFHLEILIDNSGSMCGKNIQIAKETACLLYEACTSMDNITVNVTSHNTGNLSRKECCVLRRCIIDDSVSPCGIMDLRGEGCNRDGLALRVVAEAMFRTRASDVTKLFIYINDGCPAADNYYGEYDSVLQELNSFSKKMEKEGVIFLVAGIDGDKERLEKLYGTSHFLNIEDLNSLPQRLSRILLNIIE